MTVIEDRKPPKRKLTRAEFLNELEAIRHRISSARNDLRGLLDEAEALMESEEEALARLNEAIDTLSQHA